MPQTNFQRWYSAHTGTNEIRRMDEPPGFECRRLVSSVLRVLVHELIYRRPGKSRTERWVDRHWL